MHTYTNTAIYMKQLESKEIDTMYADFCKFMSSPKWIEILFISDKVDKCVDDPAHLIRIHITNISQHLSIMKAPGIVKSRWEGTKIYYQHSNPIF